MSRTQAQAEFLEAEAYRLGCERGEAVASWYFDGSETRADYERVVRMLADGDPEIYDTFPQAPLSGEWAGDPTPADVLAELDVEPDDDAADDLLALYEDGFGVTVADTIDALARKALDALGTPDVDMDGRYRVALYGGIAWYLVGYESRDVVRAVMVGDDREFLVNVDDLEPIAREDYCGVCGQIGCTHDGYDRDDDDDDDEGGN